MIVREQAEPILGLLRAQGGRVTTSRRAILETFLGVGGHVTAEALTARVQATQPDVHESTVYRFLDELERLGVVDHVHLGHGPAVYHLASDAHHHLVCDGCGAVVEVPETVFADLRARLRDDFGFALQPRHFAVTGRCQDCTPA
ncbi:MAG TPA: transcriptional repressor [Acidimicrobiales bacterium]|nr:transcriptional repressor [Acidimicrobiales bacterium]